MIVVGVVAVVVLVIVLSSYVKAPPNKAAIISGLGKNPRILLGKAGFKIPILERTDWLGVGQIDIDVMTDDYIPTSDFINIKVDAIAQVAVDLGGEGIELAMRNFLNKGSDEVRATIAKSLQGNLREIIGTMTLKDICQNKARFSSEVKVNAADDMKKLGIEIISFNVQNIKDKDDLISDLGIDNRSQIQKDASIAKANAERDVSIAEAKAANEANKARVESELEVSQRNNELKLKQADLKVQEDTKLAEADAAYGIQEQKSRKLLEVSEQEVAIARREKEIELQAREAEVAEKKLDAEVRKRAEAEKYAEIQKAEADLVRRQKEAEASLYEQEKEAEAIRAKGKAEAEAIRAKGEAEAEATLKRAEAMKQFGQAAILEMIVGVLPEMAKAVAEPVSSIDKVTIVGGGTEVSDVANNVPILLAQTMESVKEATGIDLKDIMESNSKEAKINRKIEITGDLLDTSTVAGD